ncbi:1,4-alpha-glucan branching protein GlgB [Thermosulfurimonas dismutans]|uniref:1,4-alpha-glucan branching enzyme GlgB n=1 Tax=Thermosulfurimonas dismutans TaxID=999894 RepID=A0A179D215_9BACT|nr:1,4-alpha-glucan branching protein GlgB [Thermosulfurimonas dismutans]OAQ20114.1 1,4-alpha-glucan (glycogen) branching enzyme, GH-13-type [Thermosulfurimonas dismutans]
MTTKRVLYHYSRLTDLDIYLFREGTHSRLYEKLGAHPVEVDGEEGVYFAVWAPNATYVSVIGDFNGWDRGAHPLKLREDGSGIWEGFIPEVKPGSLYKYYLHTRNGFHFEKGDPLAFFWEPPPKTASMVWKLAYEWQDEEWMKVRPQRNALDAPWLIYEVHLGSWRRVPEDGHRFLTYRELAPLLAEYVKKMGFTHVEFLPVMEHPFYGSWGYQTTGYFAPTSRYGSPQDFMYLIDYLHREGIGVILDWVPSHFPTDAHGLAFFDGTYLYEYEDFRKRFHPDWQSYIFDYGKPEVRSFLLSSATFWLEKYHADALRIDAVASMLYLDYSRSPGGWVPNIYGGNENLEAIDFIRQLNASLFAALPGIQTIAEESTAWPLVTNPTYVGGLGFGMKWNMGWMNDALSYFSKDPIYRKYHHDQLTFSIWYAFSENFILPLSHDEVVHGKGSLLSKMPGDPWQKFANLRALFGYMWAHPGKKLLFMGGEWGQWREWNHEESLDWHLLEYPEHQGVQLLVRDLNRIVRQNPALYELDFSHEGFEWIDFHDWEKSIVSFLRKDSSGENLLVIVCNFTPVPRYEYRIGVPRPGFYREILNTDAAEYGGSGHGNFGGQKAEAVPFHGRPYSLNLTLPPLGVLYFRWEGA